MTSAPAATPRSGDRPPVAVLLPVRDGGSTLRAALDSLHAQTFRDFQLVVVDDGSADETPELLRAEHPRWPGRPGLTVLRLERSAGIAGALQAAVEVARGSELYARQDADDRSSPERLAIQVAYLERHPEVAVVATDVRTRAEGEPTDGWRRYQRWLDACHSPEEIAANLWIESPLPHPTVMMRAAAYERAGGYRTGLWPEDYDLWLRMHRLGIRMAKLPEALYEWTDHPQRASRTQPQYAAERFLECKAHHLTAFLDGRPAIVWGAGRDGRRAARALLREGARIVAFLDIDPRKIGRAVYSRPVFAAEEWLAGRASPAGDPSMEGARDTRADPAPIVLVSVGTAGARELIRARLDETGRSQGPDYLCLA